MWQTNLPWGVFVLRGDLLMDVGDVARGIFVPGEYVHPFVWNP